MTEAVKVGIQGELGAFSEIAARQTVGGKIVIVPFASFPQLFEGLKKKEVSRAVVPMENSLVGSVHENYDLLLNHHFPILRETKVHVVHCLIGHPNVWFSSIRHVHSHPMAILQCKRFLEKHREQFDVIAGYDTAGSVKMIMEENLKDSAAIAGEHAAVTYGAEILVKDIGDSHENYTRFFLLGKHGTAEEKHLGNKTSIVFATMNQPGALARCLGILSLAKLNLTKIESRPTRDKPWEYLFYADFIGNPTTSNPAQQAIRELSRNTTFLKVLGCYVSDVK